MILPDSKIERAQFDKGYDYLCGADEVGVGCLAGPVVSCAVMVDEQALDTLEQIENIRDSKLLSARQRGKVVDAIKEAGIEHSISLCSSATIDKYNILKASQASLARNIMKLAKEKQGTTLALIDGPRNIATLTLEQQPITKGDQKVLTIAAASILAKVHRDNLMIKYAKKYPDYGFDQHKGYGTQQHIAQLTALGPTPIHRRSFKPVAELV